MYFTVIVSADQSDELNQTVKSLTEQSLDFKENIEVIIADVSIDKNIKSVYTQYNERYPGNFKYEDNSADIIGNTALENADGEYVNFINSGDTFSKNTFKDILEFYKEHDDVDVVCVPTYFINNDVENHWTNSRFDNAKVVDLTVDSQYFQLFGPPTFIRRKSIGNRKFSDTPRNKTVLINEILIRNPKLGLCKTAKCKTPIILDKYPSLKDAQSSKEYYLNLCENYFKHLIHESLDKYHEVPLFIQKLITYDIGIMLNAENTQDILDENEIKEFKSSMQYILSYIDDEIIMTNKFMDDYLKINAFLLKNGKIDDRTISRFDFNTVFIDNYDIINNNLHILANIPNIFPRNVDVFVNGKKNNINTLRFPQRDKTYFNYTYATDYSFEFDIPLSKNETYEIEFKIDDQQLNIDFSRPCNFSTVVGYAKTKNYLSTLMNNKIFVEKKTTLKWVRKEIKALAKMIRERKPGYKVGIPFRIAYMIGYPFLKNKHIWFFMDRPESADDNGMHMFKYAQDKDKDIKKYFILKKDSKDYPEMKRVGNVISYKSLKHRYLGLFVENIVTTHPDNGIIYPFWGTYPHLAGLLKSNNNFLQHGIIKDDISTWLNKFSMNLSLLVTSSPKEYESIFKNPFHYPENIVRLLGLPRYDKLENHEDKKQIIIMPSWRRPLTYKSNKYIKNTEYFKRFNSLINNEKLIEAAREYDYEIIFRPHPNVYRFIELYDKNNYVEISSEDVKYQTLFNNGSLLVTDYSSVAFDFSYLYKPILYYQYLNDYHFDVEGGYFKYETMGFGEVCKEEEELVNLIIEYIKNDCKMKDKYSKRVDEFFLYKDKNNCKRVYDAIKEIPLKD